MAEQNLSSTLPAASRKFYDIPEKPSETPVEHDTLSTNGRNEQETVNTDHDGQGTDNSDTVVTPKKPRIDENTSNSDQKSIFSYIEENVIGRDKTFSGPFGQRKVVYCDYTASGRSLEYIENYIQKEVLPEYGNTHTTTTVSSLQTTLFRHEARDIVRNAVNASEHDAVIFVGSGCTAAVHKLIHALSLTEPPVVFVGSYEHHSNLLPWRELGATVIRISETRIGEVDIPHLTQQLQQWQNTGRQLIGCFSAASNVTGILVDVDTITVALHKHGALAFWDYATAGPYVKIDMHPVSGLFGGVDQQYVYKDAIFLSPHKFVGGVQTPGVLVAKKKLFRNPVPSGCGGGSVFFVRREAHRYLQEAEMREEGGTPSIVESVRAGLVFQLKEMVTPHAIMDREHQLVRRAFLRWSGVKSLVMLGSMEVTRLPIYSFLVRHPHTGLFLHHNFVCAVLNDLFGIQARGGCACAGPYAEDILGINEELATKIEDLLAEDNRLDRVHLRRYREYSDKEIIRPGFVRLNLPYFLDDETIDFVLDAVAMVAEHAWQLLPQYTFNPETGEWRHRNHQVFKDRKWLGYISYKNGHMTWRDPPANYKGPLPTSLQECLEQGRQVFTQCKKTRVHVADQTTLFDGKSHDLRWFLLPSEALLWLQDPKQASAKQHHKPPFEPLKYPREDIPPQNQFEPLGYPPKQDIITGKAMKENQQRATVQILPGRTITCAQVEKAMDKLKGSCHSVEVSKFAQDDFLIKKDINESFDFREGLIKDMNVGFMIEKDKNSENEKDFVGEEDNVKQSCQTAEEPMETEEASKLVENKGVSYANVCTNVTSGTQSSNICDDTELKQQKQNCDDVLTKSVKTAVSDKLNIENSQKKSEEKGDGDKAGFVCLAGSCFKPRSKSEKEAAVSAPSGGGIHKWHSPPNKTIFKPTVQALEEFSMIQDGDKVLVCLSGGKDSLSLLHMVRQYSFYAKKKGIDFTFGAVTVDPMTSSYDPSPLKGYLAQLGVPYFYEEQAILEQASQLPYDVASICSFCSRMKRGRIYHAARREGYNVLALGQHLDDLAESFLMSVFHNGILRTMKASYAVQEGDLRVIRPFIYVREKDLRMFAEEKGLPIIPENCPACFEAPKERHRMKQLLAAQEVMFPRLFHSVQSAIRPIMAINKTGVNAAMLLSQNAQQQEQEEEDF